MSINLSFKEWPFLSINKHSHSQQSKATSINDEDNETINYTSSPFSFENLYMKSLLQTINSLQNDENVLDMDKYPTHFHLSSWGPCGLFACTYESCLSVFSSDDNGCLTPIMMFSPFEKYSLSTINKQSLKSSIITAISWANGHLEPYISKPVLAISSDKGNVLLYNINTRSVISALNFNEPIVSLLWSSSKINRFYAGSSTGHFYICEVYKKSTIEILKMFDFSENASIISDDISKSVDFIAQDDVDGLTVAIASKDGTIGIVSNLNDPSQSQLRIIKNLNFSVSNKRTKTVLNFFEFYPNNQNFILVCASTSTFIFSIDKAYLIPLINRPNCKFASVFNGENDKAIVGDDENLTVWKLKEHSWIKLDVLKIEKVLTYSKHDDSILITTFSNWLTEIEFKRDKLFVTKRVRLMNRKPIDYDFGDGRIAFLSNRNTLCLTSLTPDSIGRSKFANERPNSSDEKKDLCGNSNSISMSFNILPKEEVDKIKNVEWISSDKLLSWCDKSLYLIDLQTRKITEPLRRIFDRMSNTITQIFFSKSHKYIGMILNHEQAYFLDAKSPNLDIVYSIDFNGIIDKDCNCLFGSISPNEEQVVFASQNALFTANLKGKKQLKKIPSNLKYNASCVSLNDKEIIIGTEKGSAFIIKEERLENLSEISKKDVEVIYDSLHIADPSDSNKLGPIQSVLYLHHNRHEININYKIILDSNGRGIIITSNEIISIGAIQNFKRISNETFLVSFENYNKLIAINTFDEFIPFLSPCFISTQAKNISFYSNKKELRKSFKDKSKIEPIIQKIFNTEETRNHSITLRNNFQFLNHILSFYNTFNFISSKTYLKLGDFNMAKNILLKSNRNDKDYLNNMLIAAFYNAESESAKPVVNNLLSNNLINEAVDILLITKDMISAAKILSESGNNKEAFYVLMLNSNISNDCREIAKKIADSLIVKKENVLFGLKLLSSFGYEQEMIDNLYKCLS